MSILHWLKRSAKRETNFHHIERPAANGGRRWDALPTAIPKQMLRARARHLYASNAYAAAAVKAIVTNAVGWGIQPVPEVKVSFAPTDVEERQNFAAICGTAVEQMVVDGEAFIQMHDIDGELRLQFLRAEEIDEGRPDRGIEHDSVGRRVRYHLADGGKVPAEDIIHLCEGEGRSWFEPVLLRLGETDKLEDALNMGVAVAAMHSAFLVNQNDMSGESPYGNGFEAGIQPGSMITLGGGWDVRFNTPQQVPYGLQLAEHEIRAIASGMGVPAHLVSGDLKRANYSSLRADMVRFRQRIETVQWNSIIPLLCAPVWERNARLAALRGDLDGFFDDPTPFLKVEWFPPRIPSVDPLKEADGLKTMIDMGLMSRRQAVAELGFDIETLDEEIAADREREKRLKLNFGGSNEPSTSNA